MTTMHPHQLSHSCFAPSQNAHPPVTGLPLPRPSPYVSHLYIQGRPKTALGIRPQERKMIENPSLYALKKRKGREREREFFFFKPISYFNYLYKNTFFFSKSTHYSSSLVPTWQSDHRHITVYVVIQSTSYDLFFFLFYFICLLCIEKCVLHNY